MIHFVLYFRNLDYLNYIPVGKCCELEKLVQQKELNGKKNHIVSLDQPRRSFNYNTDTILHVSSPNVEGDLRPRPASQSPSQVLPYVQSATLVR